MRAKRYFDIVEVASNLVIERVEEGSVSRWIAHFGGDDADLEGFLIDKEVTIGVRRFELRPHRPTPTPKKKP